MTRYISRDFDIMFQIFLISELDILEIWQKETRQIIKKLIIGASYLAGSSYWCFWLNVNKSFWEYVRSSFVLEWILFINYLSRCYFSVIEYDTSTLLDNWKIIFNPSPNWIEHIPKNFCWCLAPEASIAGPGTIAGPNHQLFDDLSCLFLSGRVLKR